jgi:hypothetical protein
VRYSHPEMIEKDRGDLSDMLEDGMKHAWTVDKSEGQRRVRNMRGDLYCAASEAYRVCLDTALVGLSF